MIRQVVFTLLLSFALATPAFAQPAASPTRPPADIPLSRLTPDAVIPLALGSGSIESTDGVWVPNRAAGSVVRIDAKDNKSGAPVTLGTEPCASLVSAFDSVWVPLCGDGTIARLDPKGPKVTATLKAKVAAGDGRTASAVGSIWALTDRKGVLSRIDPATNTAVAEVYVAAGANAVVFGEDALWVTSDGDAAKGRLTRVNPYNNGVIEVIDVGPNPGRLAVGEGGVWTLNRGTGSSGATVTRVDPATNKVVATITLGDSSSGEIAAGLGSVWISAPGVPLIRIDPRTNRAVQRFTGEGGGAVLVAHGSLWIAAGPQLTWRLDPALVSAIRP